MAPAVCRQVDGRGGIPTVDAPSFARQGRRPVHTRRDERPMRSIAGRSFLDTNILVYAFDPKAKSKREYAQLRITRALATHDAVISFQVVQEFLGLALRKFPRPMTQPEAQAY